MGARNYLIEGVSGTGKTTVCDELLRRGYQAVHGDRVLAYPGDPETGEPVTVEQASPAVHPAGGGHAPGSDCPACLAWLHERWIWNLDLARSLAADHDEPVTFFCGGSRNVSKIIQLFDGVFVLDVDLDTVLSRLARRPVDEFGGKQSERDFMAGRHRTRADRLLDLDAPKNAIVIDTSRPVAQVVDEIIRHTETIERGLTTMITDHRLPDEVPSRCRVSR